MRNLIFSRNNYRVLMVFAGLTVLGSTLRADIISSYTATNINGYANTNLGQITVTDINADEVEVNINLAPDVFADTGAGGNSLFDFNIASGISVKLASGTSIQFTSLKTPAPSLTLSLSGSDTFNSNYFSPTPTFSDSIACSGCNGVSAEISSITFYLTNTATNGTLSDADFVKDSSGKYYFGGDIGVPSGDTFNTGVAVASAVTTSRQTAAPEPAFGGLAGLLLAGLLVGQRFVKRPNTTAQLNAA